MPSGEFVVFRNDATTFSRLRARSFFCPLPVRIVSRSDCRLGFQVEVLQQRLQRLGAHAALEVLPEPVAQLSVQHLVADQLLDVELAERVQYLVQPVDLALGPVTDLAHLALAAFADLAPHVTLGALGLEFGQVRLELLGPGLDLGVALLLQRRLLRADLRLERRQVAVPLLVVHRGDQVRREVDDLLEILRRQVEQIAQAGRDTLEVPDVGNRRGELDVAHPLASHLGPGDLNPAPLADDPLEAHPLVLAAVALPVPRGTEDLLAEQAILLRLQGPVVDGLGLLHLAMAPLADVVSRGKTDP